MAYKWRPSASQRREFAERMKDPTEAAAYEARKAEKAARRREKSRYDYHTAGGEYVPTKAQHDAAFRALGEMDLTERERESCEMVMIFYSQNEKVHHDHIHVVNELIRNSSYAL